MEIWSDAGCTGDLLKYITTDDVRGFKTLDLTANPIPAPPAYLKVWKKGSSELGSDYRILSAGNLVMWKKTALWTETFDECFDLDSEDGVNAPISKLFMDVCFGANEMIRVKRDGEEGILDIPIKEAKYGDKVLAVNEKMEEIWDDVLFLDHFTECSVLSLSLSLSHKPEKRMFFFFERTIFHCNFCLAVALPSPRACGGVYPLFSWECVPMSTLPLSRPSPLSFAS